jgi:hypothetical protein
MPKKKWTEEQRLEWGAKIKAAREAKLKQAPVEPTASAQVEEQKDSKYEELQARLDEIMETNALLKAAVLGQAQASGKATAQGVIGEVDKYLIDESNYPNPTERLASEPKLVQAVNFPFNYELNYKFDTSSYQTKAGVNMREPRFMVQLNRIVVDDQGNQTDKRYVVKRLIFHEDPQAALSVARENSITVDKTDEKHFLDEMRYLRVRDWLFDIFWPKQATVREGIAEEVIGGTLVQVFTKTATEESEIPFEQLKTKY